MTDPAAAAGAAVALRDLADRGRWRAGGRRRPRWPPTPGSWGRCWPWRSRRPAATGRRCSPRCSSGPPRRFKPAANLATPCCSLNGPTRWAGPTGTPSPPTPRSPCWSTTRSTKTPSPAGPPRADLRRNPAGLLQTRDDPPPPVTQDLSRGAVVRAFRAPAGGNRGGGGGTLPRPARRSAVSTPAGCPSSPSPRFCCSPGWSPG